MKLTGVYDMWWVYVTQSMRRWKWPRLGIYILDCCMECDLEMDWFRQKGWFHLRCVSVIIVSHRFRFVTTLLPADAQILCESLMRQSRNRRHSYSRQQWWVANVQNLTVIHGHPRNCRCMRRSWHQVQNRKEFKTSQKVGCDKLTELITSLNHHSVAHNGII